MRNRAKYCIIYLFSLCKNICTRYSAFVVGCVLWLIGGLTLGIVGLLTTFFVQTLIKRMRKDSSLEESIENPFRNTKNNEVNTPDEPFDGALLVAALGVYCTGNADFSGMQMQKGFSKYYTADWVSLCRIAARSKSLNGDLIVECLGATFLKNVALDSEYENLLILVFTFLSIVEYEWNAERGIKPSVYLAELLQKPIYIQNTSDTELSTAYRLLGLSVGASFDEIKSAHRSLVALYHPDTVGDLSDEQKKIAAEAFLRIQAAYESIITHVN